jgi:hypothetical protein
MSWWEWILVALAVWLPVSLLAALLVGWMIRLPRR